MNLYEYGLKKTVTDVRNGEVRAVDFARSWIERYNSLESEVHAMAHFDPNRLIEAAEDIDLRIQQDEIVGPLAGAAIGVKDIYDCAGLPTGFGICGVAPNIPEKSASSIQKLLAAGALVHGKTVTTDRAYLDPGLTCNPWNPEHTPGGSSSGSAAGTAACMFPAALGSQTGGSVIRPASYCGVIGMTFTHGRIPMDGILPLAPTYDTAGFFVRKIEDAELLASVLCGFPDSVKTTPELPLSPLDRPVFLGFARQGFLDHVEDAAAHHTLQVTKRLMQEGAIVHVLKMPGEFADLEIHHKRIFAYEAAQVHRQEFEKDSANFGDKIAELIEEGLGVEKREYQKALEFLEFFRDSMLARISEVDSIVLPSATGGAPLGLDTTGSPLCNYPWTAIGFPAITVPSGLTEDGLPLGLQIIGKPGGEEFLLRMARFCIESIGFESPVPEVGE